MKLLQLSALLVYLSLHASVCGADDTEKLQQLFAQGTVIAIPPGDYQLDGTKPIALKSGMTVSAYGCRFVLPSKLPDQARITLFSGTDVDHFTWMGGEFIGHVFDPAQRENSWPPNALTKAIEITTTRDGATHDILFRDVSSQGIAGAVIGVHGLASKSNESEVTAWAQRVTLENCSLLRSGKFMWDYGYLWQILTFPESYADWEVERAKQYFRMDLVRQFSAKANDDRLMFTSGSRAVPVSDTDEPKEAVSLFGAELPSELKRGLQYFVVDSGADFVKLSNKPHGPAMRFARSGEGELAMNLQANYLAAYAPTGSGPGKGAFDIVGAKDVRVVGCKLSAIGDTMHIQRCKNIIFASNHILGSRMGAFFLAEYCQNATITGNLVDGTNGSRVVSVEKSCTDVTMTGNTFRGGGRGAWINQPVNFVMTGNLFVNNTTKNDPDPRTGRVAFQTADYGRFPELYFTLYEPNATYGPVIVRDNIFRLGPNCPNDAVTFAPNGHHIVFTNNTFLREDATPSKSEALKSSAIDATKDGMFRIIVDPSCSDSHVADNLGAKTEQRPVDFNHGRR